MAAVLAMLGRETMYFGVLSIQTCMSVSSVVCQCGDIHELHRAPLQFDVSVDGCLDVLVGPWNWLLFLDLLIRQGFHLVVTMASVVPCSSSAESSE